ncbi:MAG: hypothetical protein Q9165_008436 [Trypethelium subeluteriae]
MALSVTRSATSLSDTMARDFPASQEIPLTLRPKAGSFSRRRRPGVTELGSMATVQESSAIDSPTIPGRPPVRKLSKYQKGTPIPTGHGRSSSAPGSSWRDNPFGDAMLSCVTGPPTMGGLKSPHGQSSNGSPAKKKLSPGALFKPTPLEPIASPVNPAMKEGRPNLQIRTRNESSVSPERTPPIPPPKSAPLGGRNSPASNRPTPTRKNSSNALRMTPAAQRPSEKTSTESLSARSPESKVLSPMTAGSASPAVHRRQQSEAAAFDRSPPTDLSVLNRGRPIKRTQSFDHQERNPSASASSISSTEPKEVWKLPSGLKKSEAVQKLNEADRRKLHRQATSQADKFELLSERDIATLSKELRALDERCDYLRKTYRSLRAGRQKLHARMMLYLKRENGAIFTRDGLIRQEEALAELDLSLDDWIQKIEQAENRRLRIRQKVLEHFCVALTLGEQTVGSPEVLPLVMSPVAGGQGMGVGMAVRVQGIQATPEQTPPRSPVDRTDSPRMFAGIPSGTTAAAGGVPANQEVKPLLIDAGSPKMGGGDPEKRRDVQSIKIYADENVLDLFSDIEQAIDNMFDYDEKRGTIGAILEQQGLANNGHAKERKGSAATQ